MLAAPLAGESVVRVVGEVLGGAVGEGDGGELSVGVVLISGDVACWSGFGKGEV